MLIALPPCVQDFRALVQWLADEYHGGAVSAIADRLGVSVATPGFWRRGVVLPNLDHAERISEDYGIDFALVRELIFRSQQARRGRQSTRLPPRALPSKDMLTREGKAARRQARRARKETR